MAYALKLPGHIYCGEHALDEIPSIIRGRFRHAAVFTDAGICKAGLLNLLLPRLEEAGAQVTVFDDLPAEPSCDEVQIIIDRFRITDADLIVALGGGSVMDAAKLASIASDGKCTVRDLLEDPLRGKKSVATLLIPTTAGTGSEATANSIVAVPERAVKIGIVNEEMLADYVILDGETIRALPARIAAATGIDALCHAIECYTSKKATPFSNLFAMEALRVILSNLEHACRNPEALAEKNQMLLGSFYAGVAIAASGTTAVHALSYPLGGRYHIPHGVANAMLLIQVMRYNSGHCEREFAEVYDVLHPHPSMASDRDKATLLLDEMDTLLKVLDMPPKLRDYSVGEGELDILVEEAMQQQRLLVNNKRTVTAEDARGLYKEIL